MSEFHTQDFLEPDQIQAIGLIASEWSLLEAHLSVAIWRILNVDRELGLSVTADLSSLARIKLFNALAIERFKKSEPEAVTDANSLFSEMSGLNTERNNYVHNVWAPGSDPETLKTRKFHTRSGKLAVIPLERPATDLLNTAMKIGATADKLVEFRKRWTGGIPPSQPTC